MSFFHHLNLIHIFGFLGNTLSFMMFLSPIPTFYRIYKKKTTEGYQVVPYVVALFSSMLWIIYALFAPKLPGVLFLKTINSFGIFIETVYITIFLIYATREAKITAAKLIFLMNIAGFGAVVFVAFVLVKSVQVRTSVLGYICTIFSLCVFVAPLGVMRQVIRTKSVKYMPFLLSFFLTISVVVWFFYGLVTKNKFVYIPNVLGFTFGIAQMGLYAMYRNSEKTPSEIPTVDHHIIEVVKLAPQGTLAQVDAPYMTVFTDNSKNRCNVNGEETYSVDIRNCNQEMMENIKKIGGIEAVVPPNLVAAVA